VATFVGFSTVGRKKPPFTVTDIDLVKIDLLNAFNTRKGERVMNPEFGTTIHDLIMDPLDEYTKSTVLNQAKDVISGEPRVKLTGSIHIIEKDYGIRMEISLLFLPQNIVETMYIDFKNASDNAL
jgi:phage baseplate assembly protein W